MVDWRNIPTAWVLTPFLLLFFFLALNSVTLDSPTMDEQNHLARGIAFLRTGDPRLSVEHPTVVNSLSALPLLTQSVNLPLESAAWQRQPPDVFWYFFANDVLWNANRDVTRMIFLARLPIVFLTLGLALVGFHFARLLWGGRETAVLAAIFLLFDPNILAHGRLTTTDLGGTLFMTLATLLLWRLWQRLTWQRWLWATLGMGLAFGSKLSALGFVLIWGVLAVLPLHGDNRWWQRLGAFLLAGLGSIGVIWAFFAFEFGNFLFISEQLGWLNAYRGPMPTFWSGVERITLLSGGGRAGYLLEQFSDSGFALYFPIAFLAKTPLITLLLLPVGTAVLLLRQPTRRNALFVLGTAVGYFAVALTSDLNIGYRHLLPMLPFVYLLIAGGVGDFRLTIDDLRLRQYRIQFLPALLLIATTLFIHPHYLAFFNQAAGGLENGDHILIDSNLDWGQDLRRLQGWMAENEVERIKLGYFGTADPAYYGIDFEPLPGFPRPEFYFIRNTPPFDPAQPAPGLYAISVSSLWEHESADKWVYRWFRAQEPTARVGASILIYEVVE